MTIEMINSRWTPEKRAAHSRKIKEIAAKKRKLAGRPEFSKIKKNEVTIGEDGLLYRRGRPVKCKRNDEIRRRRAEGESEGEIASFLELFT